MDVSESIEIFIKQFCPGPEPLLLGLSGGPDSLALYHGLLAYQKKHQISFHIAHIDHGWRLESAAEASQLQQLAEQAGIPFHLRKLYPAQLKGNLEMACRVERYRFFTELCQSHTFQGVLVGHHCDDQSETVLKRILEGAHWSCLAGLKPETWMNGIRIWRPLLSLTKKEIYAFLADINVQPFEDASNHDEQYMRARMRKTIIPWLNSTFGKNVQPSLIKLGEEMLEVKEFFDQKSSILLENTVSGPFGIFLDLQRCVPSTLLEIKYLLRNFCSAHAISLSRGQYQSCAESILKNEANKRYENGCQVLYVDRQRLFILKASEFSETVPIEVGENRQESWRIDRKDQIRSNFCTSTLSELWQGTSKAWLPEGVYQASPWRASQSNRKALDKWWTNQRVPAFLRSIFPVICQGTVIVHEFLTGRSKFPLISGQKGIEIVLRYVQK